MAQGFVLDVTHGGRVTARWVEGKPERSFWLGVKTKGHACREIESWRCEDCGLLREYATTPIQPNRGW